MYLRLSLEAGQHLIVLFLPVSRPNPLNQPQNDLSPQFSPPPSEGSEGTLADVFPNTWDKDSPDLPGLSFSGMP